MLANSYRLNVFGFPGNPNAPNNHGLRDVRLAMKWVRENVAGFGGDVTRITMMGQSAGAGMIDHYTYAFADDPIASSFIMLSGASEGYNGPVTPDRGEKTWLTLANNIGCASSAEDDRLRRAAVLECMMEKPAQHIVDGMAMDNIQGGFEPYDDGVLVHADHSNMTSARGSYLLGVANFEGGIHLPVWPNAPKFVIRALGHIVINCPTAERVNKALMEGHPTWRYRYFGEFPNLEATTSPPSGSWHGSDVSMMLHFAYFPSTNPASRSRFCLTRRPRKQSPTRPRKTAWARTCAAPLPRSRRILLRACCRMAKDGLATILKGIH